MEAVTHIEGSSGFPGSAMKSPEFGIRLSDETDDVEDEWRDFTEENCKQYTSSRRSIQMSLSSIGGEVKVQELEQLDTGGDGIDVGQAHNDGMANTFCPWQKMEDHLEVQASKNRKGGEQSDKKEEPTKTKSQIYIPPALRQSQGDFNQNLQVKSRLPKTQSKVLEKGQAPDLNSSEYFPTLSGSKIFKRTK